MRANMRIASLAIGLSLTGCGVAPSGLLPGTPAAAPGWDATRTINAMGEKPPAQVPGTREATKPATREVTKPATPGTSQPAVSEPGTPPAPQPAPVAETGKPSHIETMMIKRLFAYLENKNPAAKDKLHSLEQRLLGLNKQQMNALRAVRYQERKDKTLDQIRQELEGFMKNPDTLIADITDDLDKVSSMSAQDLTATNAQLPPVFLDIMKAVEEPVMIAGHDGEGTVTPTPTGVAGESPASKEAPMEAPKVVEEDTSADED